MKKFESNESFNYYDKNKKLRKFSKKHEDIDIETNYLVS